MTGKERFGKIMDFEQPDQLPNYELSVWPQAVERWKKEGMPPDTGDFNWFGGAPYFHLDRREFAYINVSMIPCFDYEVLQEDDRYIVARNAMGIVTKALKEGSIGGGRMCMDQYISHPVTDRKSFLEIKKRDHPNSPGRYPVEWDKEVQAWKERTEPLCLLGNGSFGLYSQLRSWVGTEEISYLFYDDPAFVEEMLDFAVDFLLQTTEKALNEVAFDYFNFFEDCAGKGGPLISPQIFKKFFLPRYRRIIDRFRQSGIKYFWFDCDGDPEVLIPLLLEAGITCLWPLEQASGMDPVRLHKKYGKNLALAGGIDKIALTKDKKAIEQELYAKIPPLLEKGGFIPHLDHTFPPDISYENFRYYLELKSKLLRGEV